MTVPISHTLCINGQNCNLTLPKVTTDLRYLKNTLPSNGPNVAGLEKIPFVFFQPGSKFPSLGVHNWALQRTKYRYRNLNGGFAPVCKLEYSVQGALSRIDFFYDYQTTYIV